MDGAHSWLGPTEAGPLSKWTAAAQPCGLNKKHAAMAERSDVAAAALELLDQEDSARLIVDDQLRVHWLNGAAERGFASSWPIDICSGELCAARTDHQRQLLELVARAERAPASVCLRSPSCDELILIRARAASNGRANTRLFGFTIIPERRPFEYRDLDVAFDLTPAEHRVLLAVIDEGTPQEIARAFGVSCGTVRAQLRSIYSKMGVTKRDELFRRVRPFRI